MTCWSSPTTSTTSSRRCRGNDVAMTDRDGPPPSRADGGCSRRARWPSPPRTDGFRCARTTVARSPIAAVSGGRRAACRRGSVSEAASRCSSPTSAVFGIRLGARWIGLTWADVERVEVSERGRIRDGRVAVVARDRGVGARRRWAAGSGRRAGSTSGCTTSRWSCRTASATTVSAVDAGGRDRSTRRRRGAGRRSARPRAAEPEPAAVVVAADTPWPADASDAGQTPTAATIRRAAGVVDAATLGRIGAAHGLRERPAAVGSARRPAPLRPSRPRARERPSERPSGARPSRAARASTAGRPTRGGDRRGGGCRSAPSATWRWPTTAADPDGVARDRAAAADADAGRPPAGAGASTSTAPAGSTTCR